MSGDYLPKTYTSVAVGEGMEILVFLLVALVLLDLKGGDVFLFAAGWITWDVLVALWRDRR